MHTIPQKSVQWHTLSWFQYYMAQPCLLEAQQFGNALWTIILCYKVYYWSNPKIIRSLISGNWWLVQYGLVGYFKNCWSMNFTDTQHTLTSTQNGVKKKTTFSEQWLWSEAKTSCWQRSEENDQAGLSWREKGVHTWTRMKLKKSEWNNHSLQPQWTEKHLIKTFDSIPVN